MGFNTIEGINSGDEVSTAIVNQIHVDGTNTKVLPAGEPPRVVYRIGDGTVHPDGFENVDGYEYLDFYVSTGATGADGEKGDTGSTGAKGDTGDGSGDMLKSLNLSDVANANTSLNNILPDQTGNADKVLTTDGTDASWTASLPATPLPTLTGTSPVDENTVTVITVTNYDASLTYYPSVDFGSTVDNGDGTHSITMPDYDVAPLVTFSIYAAKAGQSDSATATFSITSTELIVADPTLSGLTNADENTDVVITIDNWDSNVTYVPAVTSGSVVDNLNGTLTVSLADYDVATSNTLSVYGTRAGYTTSGTTNHVITVNEILIPTLPTPLISGAVTGVELTDLVLTVTNWDVLNTYVTTLDFGSVVDNLDGTFTITLPDYSASTSISFTIKSQRAGYVDSAVATHNASVTNTVTTTPTLTGAATVLELNDLIVTITNYSATATYTHVSSNVGDTVGRVGDTITVSAASVGADTPSTLTVTAQEPTDIVSADAVHNFTVTNETTQDDTDYSINVTGSAFNATNYPTATGGYVDTTVGDEGLVATLLDINTIDAISKGTNVTLSNGDLTATTSASSFAENNTFSEVAITDGNIFFEVTVDVAGDAFNRFIGFSTNNTDQANYIGAGVNGYTYYGDGNKYNNGASAYGASYTAGDVIGCRYSYVTGEVEFYKNGVSQGIAWTITAGTTLYMAQTLYANTSAHTANFGETAFAYPVAGTTKLSGLTSFTHGQTFTPTFACKQDNTAFQVSFDDVNYYTPAKKATGNTFEGDVYEYPNSSTTDAIPTMTTDTAPSGTVTYSSQNTPWDGFESFSNPLSTYFWQTLSGTTGWIGYQFPTATVIDKYTLEADSGLLTRMCKDWTLEASNTGTFTGEETILDTVVGETGWLATTPRTFTFTNSTAYTHYRLVVTAVDGGTLVGIRNIELIEGTLEAKKSIKEQLDSTGVVANTGTQISHKVTHKEVDTKTTAISIGLTELA